MKDSKQETSWAVRSYLTSEPPRSVRFAFYAVLVSLITAIGISSLLRVTVSTPATGMISSRENITPIKANDQFVIKEIFVEPNQEVKKGELMLISQTQLSNKEYEELVGDIDKLQTNLFNKNLLNCVECIKKILDTSRYGLRISKEGNLRAKLITLNQKVIRWSNLIDLKPKDWKIQERNLRSELTLQIESIGQTVEQYRKSQSIAAPFSGTVSKVFVGGPGENVESGQPILEILPSDAELIGRIRIKNKDIASINVELPVVIQIDAFPSSKFGTVAGTIESISPVASKNPITGIQDFEAVVNLTANKFMQNKQEYPFRIGMSLSAEVISGSQSLLLGIIESILNWKRSTRVGK